MEPDQISSVEADWSGSTLFVREFVFGCFLTIFQRTAWAVDFFVGTVRVKFIKVK